MKVAHSKLGGPLVQPGRTLLTGSDSRKLQKQNQTTTLTVTMLLSAAAMNHDSPDVRDWQRNADAQVVTKMACMSNDLQLSLQA